MAHRFYGLNRLTQIIKNFQPAQTSLIRKILGLCSTPLYLISRQYEWF